MKPQSLLPLCLVVAATSPLLAGPGLGRAQPPGRVQPSRPAISRPVTPGQSRPLTPGQQRPATPGQSRPLTPGQQRPVTPRQDRRDTPPTLTPPPPPPPRVTPPPRPPQDKPDRPKRDKDRRDNRNHHQPPPPRYTPPPPYDPDPWGYVPPPPPPPPPIPIRVSFQYPWIPVGDFVSGASPKEVLFGESRSECEIEILQGQVGFLTIALRRGPSTQIIPVSASYSVGTRIPIPIDRTVTGLRIVDTIGGRYRVLVR